MRILSQLSLSSARRKGLTLIEILVVSVIFAIIATSLFVVFKAGLDSWSRAKSHLNIYENARVILDMITRDLRGAYILPSSGNISGDSSVDITFKGFDSSSPSGWRTNNIGDELYFVAASNPSINNPNAIFDLCKVGYWLNGKGTANVSDDELERIYVPQTSAPGNFTFGAGDSTSSSRLSQYVTQLNFRYYDPTTSAWSNTWDSGIGGAQAGRLPRSVEVTITVREPYPINPNNPKIQQFVTNIYIPGSQR